MIKNVSMSNCNFKVDKEKRTIVCWIDDTKEFFSDFVRENAPWEIRDVATMYPEEDMNNHFTGVARCAEDDEWNEDIGKRLAFYRMKRKMFDSFYNKIRFYFDTYEKMLDNFEETCIAYRNKVERSISRQEAIIMEYANGNEKN